MNKEARYSCSCYYKYVSNVGNTKQIESPTFNARQGMLRCGVFNFNPPSKFPLMMWLPYTWVILCVTYGVPRIGGRRNNNLTFGDSCVALVSSITCKDQLSQIVWITCRCASGHQRCDSFCLLHKFRRNLQMSTRIFGMWEKYTKASNILFMAYPKEKKRKENELEF